MNSLCLETEFLAQEIVHLSNNKNPELTYTWLNFFEGYRQNLGKHAIKLVPFLKVLESVREEELKRRTDKGWLG